MVNRVGGKPDGAIFWRSGSLEQPDRLVMEVYQSAAGAAGLTRRELPMFGKCLNWLANLTRFFACSPQGFPAMLWIAPVLSEPGFATGPGGGFAKDCLMRLPRLATPIFGLLLSALAAVNAAELPLDERSLWELDLPVKERHRLAALIERQVLDIAPVVQAPLTGTHTHLGWPVATQLPSGRIVVVFRQRDGHNGSDEGDRWVIHSDDLVTWHPGEVLANKALRLGESSGMYAVGWAPRPDNGEPRLVIFNGPTDTPALPPRAFRAYLSDDLGLTWTETTPFGDLLHAAENSGPNLIRHPVFGLVGACGQTTGSVQNAMVSSHDAGLTWQRTTWNSPSNSRPREPALATWGPGHMVMLSREYSTLGYGDDPARTYFYLTQHVYAYSAGDTFQDVNFTTVASNIAGNGAAQSDSIVGRSSQDTADVFFNPVSGRIEMLQSHRWGSGGYTPESTLAPTLLDERSSLNLWSIDPDELLAGSNQWRFDGTLLLRIGNARPGNKDGLHPGGSVIDLERGLQHIFVYTGWRRGPTSIYRISRTLDTARWLTNLAEVDEELAGFEPPPEFGSVYWTGEGNRYGGQTNAWSTFSYEHPDFPAYGLASANGVSNGETWNFVYDLTRLRGSTTSVRMNRNDVTIASLTLIGSGSAGFTFTNVDNTGTGHRLAGPVTVSRGTHLFEAPTPGRTVQLTTDSTWTIGEGATLRFNHVLAGPYNLTKSGPGTLLVSGNQLHTGDTIVDNGVFGLGDLPATLAGDLYFGPGSRLRFHPLHPITVLGKIAFEDRFGIVDVDGLQGNVMVGSYQLIAGDLDTASLRNVGPFRAVAIGPDRWAYFETDGGLRVQVVDVPPPAPVLAISGIAIEADRPVLTVDAPAGMGLAIESSDGLADWTQIDSIHPTQTPVQWTGPPTSGADRRFYRIRLDDEGPTDR